MDFSRPEFSQSFFPWLACPLFLLPATILSDSSRKVFKKHIHTHSLTVEFHHFLFFFLKKQYRVALGITGSSMVLPQSLQKFLGLPMSFLFLIRSDIMPQLVLWPLYIPTYSHPTGCQALPGNHIPSPSVTDPFFLFILLSQVLCHFGPVLSSLFYSTVEQCHIAWITLL